MALSASTVFEINSGATASNVNGGGFNPANANMLTDLTTDSNTANTNSPVCSSASYNFVAGDVGHWLYVKSGTNWTPGWYQIASVASNKATLSAAVGQAIQIANNLYGTNTVAGCATVGTPTSGTFTIDYSQSTASPFASTDIALATNTTMTSVTNPFTLVMVGNLIHITAGTGFTVGWYEISSVAAGTATIDRAAGTAPLTNGTGKVGGALSLGSSDDAVFELAVSSSTASARYFIKNGTYTLGGTVSVAANGNAAWPIIYEGYATTRGDRPTASTRPILNVGTVIFTGGQLTDHYSLIFTQSAASGNSTVTLGTNSKVFNSKYMNISTTTDKNALSLGATSSAFYCEAVSYRGYGIDASTNGTGSIFGCYVHDCNIGIVTGANTEVINCIVNNCVTDAIVVNSTNNNIIGNTLYGQESKLGVGLAINVNHAKVINNIIYGFVTGVTGTGTKTSGIDNYNNYYNNTNDVDAATNWQKGANDKALDPVFTSVAQRTGSTATTTAGNHLVQSGATFQTWGVTAGRDFVYISAGTGVTAGIYGILSVDSETQITADITLSANATADKVWSITTGRDFSIGTNLKAQGNPGAFPAALSTGYLDIGAVQRQEAGGGGGLASNPIGGFVT